VESGVDIPAMEDALDLDEELEEQVGGEAVPRSASGMGAWWIMAVVVAVTAAGALLYDTNRQQDEDGVPGVTAQPVVGVPRGTDDARLDQTPGQQTDTGPAGLGEPSGSAAEVAVEQPAGPSRLEEALRAGSAGEEGTSAEPAVTTPEEVDAEGLEERVLEAERLYKRGKRRAATEAVEQLLEEDPDNARALVLRSNLLIEDGELDEALAAASASIAADPQLALGHLAVGVIEQERKEYQQALDAYERYLELDPDGMYARSVKRQLRRLQAKVERQTAGREE